VATEIKRAGGTARVAQVDALDEAAIEGISTRWWRKPAASISRSMRWASMRSKAYRSSISPERLSASYCQLVSDGILTSRGAAQRMIKQESGVILTVIPAAAGTGLASGFGAACATVDSTW
jgi:hypothetical protein